MNTTNITHIANLADILSVNEIQHIIVSPGSRNAPLVIAFDNHPNIKTYVVHDERSAAFFALGLSENIQKPVAIVCTSGSAALNYAPAVAEAFYRQIPLLVLTADRPEYLINQGDGQCIDQNNIYANYCKAFYALPELPKTGNEINESTKIVGSAINQLVSEPCGPVHLNIPLHEPLYQIASYETKELSPVLIENNDEKISTKKLDELNSIWDSSSKKLIIIGQLTEATAIKHILDLLSSNSSLAILVENTSNLQNFHKYCHSIDRTLALIDESEIENFAPELILSFGGAIVSKKIKTFFRNNKPKHNWRIGNYLIDEDTFLSKTETIKIRQDKFLKLFINREDLTNSNYGNLWKTKDFLALERHEMFLEKLPYSDLKVFELILDTLPEDNYLQMANSSVVRYCQLFNPIPSVKYYANRGVSGIDGSTSTAVGMAAADPDQLVTLITGDISFFYDSNALWNSYLSGNLRVILINNGGGGIFNILEGSRKSKQNDLFVAPHQAKAKSICMAFDVEYCQASSLEELSNLMYSFYVFSDNNRPKLMEVNTSQANNHESLMAYFEFLGESENG